ncbi:MAG: mucoidy inhibitor MuiA family protein, partial [Cytophagaceae bacterium]
MMNQWQRTWCYVAGLLLLGQTVIAQPRSQPVTSRIDRVTVFTKGAQTVRRSKAALQQGRNELVFTGISPTLDPRSLQVRGEGTFTILSVVHQLNSITEAKQAEDLTELNSQRQTVKKRMTTDQKLLEVFKNEEKLLKDNQNVSTVSVGVKTAELKELADFQRTRLTEVLMKQLDIEGRLQQSDSLLKRIDQRLRNYSGPREIASSEVVVTISAVAATNGLFEISYYVPNAGWFPNYDLRVKDVNNPVEITLKANVSQQSGEDWRDVKLTVSTGNPTESSVAPGLLPWRVGFGYP